MITKESSHNGKMRITFSMPAGIWADTIHLVGDFNGWNKTATPLRLNEHSWCVSLELDANQAYQYRYLVNGTDWYNDWRADRYVPNELGGDNSVIETGLQREVGHPLAPAGVAGHRGAEATTRVQRRHNVVTLSQDHYAKQDLELVG